MGDAKGKEAFIAKRLCNSKYRLTNTEVLKLLGLQSMKQAITAVQGRQPIGAGEIQGHTRQMAAPIKNQEIGKRLIKT